MTIKQLVQCYFAAAIMMTCIFELTSDKPIGLVIAASLVIAGGITIVVDTFTHGR